MVSKTAKIIAFFLLLGLITTSGVLAQESPYMIPVFNNVSDVPEKPSDDIEFNGITIIFVGGNVFMPKNRIEPLDFKDDFTIENVNKNQKDFKDDLKAGRRDAGEFLDYFLDENITFKEYPDSIDNKRFFKSFLDRHPFMRFELEPVEVEDWTVKNNITLNGKIRVHAIIFKNGFSLISLVFPIVTEELKYKYLFSIEDRELEKKISGGCIPDELEEMFQTKGILLSETTTITQENEDKWVITDEEKKNTYFVRKEEERLNIYKNNLEGDFLVANKSLKPDDVINITQFKVEGNISLKEGEMSLSDMFERRSKYLEEVFFEDKPTKNPPGSIKEFIYSWNINKTLGNSTELVKENPWEIYGILSASHIGSGTLKHFIFSAVSEVFTSNSSLFQIFGRVGYFEYEHEDNRTIKQIEKYGYNPAKIRLAEVVFLQEYMLESYNDFVTVKLEELREKEEGDYPKEVKEIVRFRKEIVIALDEFYLIADSLRYYDHCDFVRYGKQKRNLDFMHEILRARLEELRKISVDMNNVVMQEKIALLTWLGILLAFCLFFGDMYSEEIKTKLRRLRERKAKK